MFDQKTSKFAAGKMGLSDNWSICYVSVQTQVIYDTDELAELLHETSIHEDGPEDVREVLEGGISYIDLPDGLRIIGMKNETSKERKFALVDFSELGAA